MEGKLGIEVEAKLTVSRETADACLGLVSLFINENKNFKVHSAKNNDGTISFYLVDYSGVEEEENEA